MTDRALVGTCCCKRAEPGSTATSKGRKMKQRTEETKKLIKVVVRTAGKRGKTIGQISEATGEEYPKLRRILMLAKNDGLLESDGRRTRGCLYRKL